MAIMIQVKHPRILGCSMHIIRDRVGYKKVVYYEGITKPGGALSMTKTD